MTTIFEVATYATLAVGVGGLASKVLPPILAACEGFIAEFLATVAKLFFVSKVVNDSDTQGIVLKYLNHKSRGYGNLEDLYEVKHNHIRPLDRKQAYFIRYMWTTWRLWFFNRVPILMIPASSDKPLFTFLRGTVNWNQLVLNACDWDHEKQAKLEEERKDFRFKIVHMRGESQAGEVGISRLQKGDEASPASAPRAIGDNANYEPVGWNPEDIGEEISENPTESLAMNDHMQEVVRQVEFWKSHEQWYKDREIPWKMGVLLYGPPGTGKTSLVRSIGMKLDMPIYSFDLSTMDSREFIKFWDKTRSERTRIVLLEDIDAVFHRRQNAVKGHRLSFDVVLNVLDGIERDDGQLLFVTTNKIEEVDEALGRPNVDGESTRPGRIDLTFEIGKLDHNGRLKLAKRILHDDMEAQKMAIDYPDDTPVIFRERCRKLAINMLWSNGTRG